MFDLRSLFLVAILSACQTAAPPEESLEARAERIHREAIVLDTHIDTTQHMMVEGWTFTERHEPPERGAFPTWGEGSHVDLPRMREGDLDGAFFSVWVPGTMSGPEAVEGAREQIETVRNLALENESDFALCVTAEQVRAAHRHGKIAVLLGVEGGHMIDDNLEHLRSFAQSGVRYLTLTHSVNTDWADSSGEESENGGLTDFGAEVVRELNRLGVMVDISHVADETFWDVLEVSEAPLLASHSSSRAIAAHPRNLTDEMILALGTKGGVVQINFFDNYLDQARYEEQMRRRPERARIRTELEKKFPGPENREKRREELRAAMSEMPPLPPVSWQKIVEHIDHVVRVAGVDHVGLGSDFDGAVMPDGMEDCTQLAKITKELLRKGYSDENVKKVLGGNLLRLMEEVERAAKKSRSQTES